MTNGEQGTTDYEWVNDYTRKVLDFFWFSDWDVKVEPVYGLQRKDNSGSSYSTHAECETVWAYRMATISIDRQFWEDFMREPTKQAELTLIHECLHVVLAELGHAAQTICRVFTEREPDGSMFSIYINHEEHLVSKLTYAMHQAIGPAIVEQEEAA